MDDEKFAFSGLPSYLEGYKCYNDLASKDWIDGRELRERRSTWDKRAIAKWNFFYRPFRPIVGRPQKDKVHQREAAIAACEDYKRQATVSIAGLEERVRKAMRNLVILLAVLAVVALWWGSRSTGLALLPAAAAVYAVHRFVREQRQRLKQIAELRQKITEYEAAIRQNQSEIRTLEGEIAELLRQIPEIEGAATIEKWLAEELADMELVLLSDVTGETVTRERARELLKQDFKDQRVLGLLLDSWGLLQPPSQRGPFGREATGLEKAREDLKERAATWQLGKSDNPVFRLWYLQYIFPLEKNLTICSFFYDFVTRRHYGERFETFQYNHVTNYSIREVEPDDDPRVHQLDSSNLARSLQGKSLKALSIAVASGNHFRCVLVDEEVVDVLNECLNQDQKYRSIEGTRLSDEEVQKRFHGERRLIDAWRATEKARIETELKEIVREKRQILWEKRRSAKAMLAHVRSCVEQYVLQVQQPV